MAKSLAGVFIISLVLVSCAPQEPDKVALKALIDEYNAIVMDGMLSGNNEKVWPYYTDDAIQMPASGPMLKGKEAIKNFSDEMSKMGMKFTAVEFATTEIGGSGTLAYEIGTYKMSMELGPTKMEDNGKYMTLWKKQADGSWKVYAETWNSSVSMAP
ncbi:MAG: DUF4440 domain-containing protein [Bacteroidota bacterium]